MSQLSIPQPPSDPPAETRDEKWLNDLKDNLQVAWGMVESWLDVLSEANDDFHRYGSPSHDPLLPGRFEEVLKAAEAVKEIVG